MTREEVILTTLSISRIGQKVYFQIPLPIDHCRIMGFEYGTMARTGIGMKSPLFYKPPSDPTFYVHRNKVIGRITFWSASPENIFYQQDLIEYRNELLDEGIAANLWCPRPPGHIFAKRREEDPFSVCCRLAVLEGYYVDSWGVQEYSSMSYRLHLYLWIEKDKL